MIEPSDQERAELPECTAIYLQDLEARIDEQSATIKYALQILVNGDVAGAIKALEQEVGDNER